MPDQPVEKFVVRKELPIFHPMHPMHPMHPPWYAPRAMSGLDSAAAGAAFSAAAGAAFGLAAWWLMKGKKKDRLMYGGIGAGVGVLSHLLFAPKHIIEEAAVVTNGEDMGCIGGCW